MQNTFRKILGGAISLCVGVAAGVAVLFVYRFSVEREPLDAETLMAAIGGPLEIIGGIAFPIWVIILLPLYMLLPRDSLFWRIDVCTLLGTLAGASTSFLIIVFMGGFDSVLALWMCILAGAVTSGVTCCCGALTVNYFDRTSAT